MKLKYEYRDNAELETGLEHMIPLGEAEVGLLTETGQEDAANDNVPLLDVVKGAVWRDVEILQSQAGAGEEHPIAAVREDLCELDFTTRRSDVRGFLDEG
ncbi:MAG: hypothetical protein V7701_10840 [Sneathiella sp.]